MFTALEKVQGRPRPTPADQRTRYLPPDRDTREPPPPHLRMGRWCSLRPRGARTWASFDDHWPVRRRRDAVPAFGFNGERIADPLFAVDGDHAPPFRPRKPWVGPPSLRVVQEGRRFGGRTSLARARRHARRIPKGGSTTIGSGAMWSPHAGRGRVQRSTCIDPRTRLTSGLVVPPGHARTAPGPASGAGGSRLRGQVPWRRICLALWPWSVVEVAMVGTARRCLRGDRSGGPRRGGAGRGVSRV